MKEIKKKIELKNWDNFETELAFIILHRMETIHDMEYMFKFIKKYIKSL